MGKVIALKVTTARVQDRDAATEVVAQACAKRLNSKSFTRTKRLVFIRSPARSREITLSVIFTPHLIGFCQAVDLYDFYFAAHFLL